MRIKVVAPARPITPALADRLHALAAQAGGVELAIDPQCFLAEGHFAGPDAARADAFVRAANDPAVDALWFARGGYGANRILAWAMPRLEAAATRKTYLGYSDAGFLLGALYAQGIGRPAHGPMPGDLAREGGEAAVARALGWLARGDRSALEPALDDHPVAAFNLTILASLAGTPWLPDLAGHVLLIEEVSEPLYRVDRALFQLAHTSALRSLAGVRLGRVSDVPDNDPPWGEPLETMIARWCGEMGVAFLGGAQIGHGTDNCVVPFGRALVRLS